MLGEHSVNVTADHVAIDNVAAAETAVKHLTDLGYRRIAAIGANPHRGTAALRLQGYSAALRAARLRPDPELVASVEKYHRADGYAAMSALLGLPTPPDAVFCFNDLLAIGAMSAAADRGLRIPDQLAVVGFDDIEEGAYANPRLTTIAPDKQAIADTAVELLHDRASADSAAPATPVGGARNAVTPHSLIVRQSSMTIFE
jgi:DNA-binding LacI/PurR family transcriptional regulator